MSQYFFQCAKLSYFIFCHCSKNENRSYCNHNFCLLNLSSSAVFCLQENFVLRRWSEAHYIQMDAFFETRSENTIITHLALFLIFMRGSQMYALPGYCMMLFLCVCNCLIQVVRFALHIVRNVKLFSEIHELFYTLKESAQKYRNV